MLPARQERAALFRCFSENNGKKLSAFQLTLKNHTIQLNHVKNYCDFFEYISPNFRRLARSKIERQNISETRVWANAFLSLVSWNPIFTHLHRFLWKYDSIPQKNSQPLQTLATCAIYGTMVGNLDCLSLVLWSGLYFWSCLMKPVSSNTIRVIFLICLKRSAPRCRPPYHRVMMTSTFSTL